MNQRSESLVNHPALLPVTGNYDRKPRNLDRDVTILGRARGSDLCLEGNEVSTLHCIIYRAADGFRIRDCGSRTGTRVNGESIKNHVLRDGDIINVGSFSFEMRVPAVLFKENKLDPARVAHWMQSRRKLAGHALKYRDRLRATGYGARPRSAELSQKARQLREKIQSYDHRNNDLEQAERELAQDRQKLGQDTERHREHVREIEARLAERLDQAEAEIRQRWQEFQQRCVAEEARIAKLGPASADSAKPDLQAFAALNQLERELVEQQQRLREQEDQLSRQQHDLQVERQEFLSMKEQWSKSQNQSASSLEEQRALLAEQEAALHAQKAQLMRMMAELKKMQEDMRKQPKGDNRVLQAEIQRLQQENADLRASGTGHDNVEEVRALLEENDRLRAATEELQGELRQRDAQMNGRAAPIGEVADSRAFEEEFEKLHRENELLKKLLREKTQAAEANNHAQARPNNENDLERYEAELNEYRRQLDVDRAKLNKEVELLRERNKELDEAIREMEMEMSKERADLARERTRLERVRDEIKADMERLQREIAVRDTMAPVHKLREEITGKPAASHSKSEKALNDRLRSLHNQLSDSAS